MSLLNTNIFRFSFGNFTMFGSLCYMLKYFIVFKFSYGTCQFLSHACQIVYKYFKIFTLMLTMYVHLRILFICTLKLCTLHFKISHINFHIYRGFGRPVPWSSCSSFKFQNAKSEGIYSWKAGPCQNYRRRKDGVHAFTESEFVRYPIDARCIHLDHKTTL